MSKENSIAFHGSKANYETLKLKELGLVPPCVWRDGKAIPKEATLRKGVGDADLDVSVSVSWSPKVSCFFPPKETFIYLYMIDMKGLEYKDVDAFAKTEGLVRDYMMECALGQVPLKNIIGYCIVLRRPPPEAIEHIVAHEMEAIPGPYFPTGSEADTGYKELLAATQGKFRIAKSIVGTFHTTDSLPSKVPSMNLNRRKSIDGSVPSLHKRRHSFGNI